MTSKSPSNPPMTRLIRALSRFPGIGEKAASRLALFLIRDKQGLIHELLEALTLVREKARFCQNCENIADDVLCPLCKDDERDRRIICVVQEPVDVTTIEKTGQYRGLYHVLHGALSPLEGSGPEDIRLGSLIKRVREGGIVEVLLATNPNSEGEATALYIKKILSEDSVKLTRIASGIPVGASIEYTDAQTMSQAIENRREF